MGSVEDITRQSADGGLAVASLQGGRLDVTINRPAKRNALSRAALAELKAIFEKQACNQAVKLVVLTGAGDKSFAAGGDLNDLSSVRSLDEAMDFSRETQQVLDAIRAFPTPVIAALNGDALGGGAELAVACDLRVASSSARIGFVQGTLAITTAWGGGPDLVALLGPAQALRLLSRSERLSAGEAQSIGLIDQLAAPGQQLAEAVAEFVAPMLRQARQVLVGFKALTAAHRRGASRAEMETIETTHFASAWVHDDHWAAANRILRKDAS